MPDAEGETPNRVISERKISHVHPDIGGLLFPTQVSPDNKRITYAVSTIVRPGTMSAKPKDFVVVDGEEGKLYDYVRDPVFSADSKRVGYAAKEGKKWFVVVDREEGKQHDFVRDLVFGPDSKRVAYVAAESKKEFVMMNGKEGKQHDLYCIFGLEEGARIAFDSPDRLHYLAKRGDDVYLVEERVR